MIFFSFESLFNMSSKLFSSELPRSFEIAQNFKERDDLKELEGLFGKLDIEDSFNENELADQFKNLSIQEGSEIHQKLDILLNSLHQEHHFRKQRTMKKSNSMFMKKSKVSKTDFYIPRKLMSEYKTDIKLVSFRKHDSPKKDETTWKILKEIIYKE
jgi:hypothetical protein